MKTENTVLVSVVMSCYNSEPIKLREAINSILNQTYQNFELIIVDDGSRIPIENLIKATFNDERIHVYRIPNSGLGAALNYGISKSIGKYIARIDDDDLSCTDRLQKQVEYLDLHADCSCVGAMHYDKYKDKYLKHRKYPTEHNEIIKSLLSLKWAMAHTLVMFRRDCFDKIGGYRVQKAGEDLDLFIQLGTVGRLANLNYYLAYYTMSLTGLSVSYSKTVESHLFAINDVVNRNLFPTYIDIAKQSKERLESKLKSTPRKSYIRNLIILRIRFFGKKFFSPRNLGTR